MTASTGIGVATHRSGVFLSTNFATVYQDDSKLQGKIAVIRKQTTLDKEQYH